MTKVHLLPLINSFLRSIFQLFATLRGRGRECINWVVSIISFCTVNSAWYPILHYWRSIAFTPEMCRLINKFISLWFCFIYKTHFAGRIRWIVPYISCFIRGRQNYFWFPWYLLMVVFACYRFISYSHLTPLQQTWWVSLDFVCSKLFQFYCLCSSY